METSLSTQPRAAWVAGASIVVVLLSGCVTQLEQDGVVNGGAPPVATATPSPTLEPPVEEPQGEVEVEQTPLTAPSPRVPLDCEQLGAAVPELAGLTASGTFDVDPSGYPAGPAWRMVGVLRCSFASGSESDVLLNLQVYPEPLETRPVFWGTGDNEPDQESLDVGRDAAIACAPGSSHCEGYVMLEDFTLTLWMNTYGIGDQARLELITAAGLGWGAVLEDLRPLREAQLPRTGSLSYGTDCPVEGGLLEQALLNAFDSDITMTFRSTYVGDNPIAFYVVDAVGEATCQWEASFGPTLRLHVIPGAAWAYDSLDDSFEHSPRGLAGEQISIPGAERAGVAHDVGETAYLDFVADDSLVLLEYFYFWEDGQTAEGAQEALMRVAEAIIATAPRTP